MHTRGGEPRRVNAVERRYTIASAAEMEALAARLAACCPAGSRLHLLGELAAGKTTFARGYIQALGHAGAVKSPTFTLVESYELPQREVHHFDLYRVVAASELEFIGIDEYLNSGADCLIEWAERGAGALAPADVEIHLRVTDAGREARLSAGTARGCDVISALSYP